MRRLRLVPLLWLLLAAPAGAHEVHHAVEAALSVAVSFTYADGKPFAYEAFEAYPDGSDVPAQVGRTDAAGRAVFVPGAIKRWHVKAFSADGHGADIRIDAPPFVPLAGSGSPPADGGPNRASLLLFGLSALFGIFGIYQLWLRRKS